MKNKFKKEIGITLIALIVTIIVLIILAGISVNLLLGDNGILTKAKDVALVQEKAEVCEKIKLSLSAKQIETRGTLTQVDLDEVLEQYGTVVKENGITVGITPTDKDYNIPLSEIYTGNVELNFTVGNDGKLYCESNLYTGEYEGLFYKNGVKERITVTYIEGNRYMHSDNPAIESGEYNITFNKGEEIEFTNLSNQTFIGWAVQKSNWGKNYLVTREETYKCRMMENIYDIMCITAMTGYTTQTYCIITSYDDEILWKNNVSKYSSIYFPTPPAREGYTFKYWALKDNTSQALTEEVFNSLIPTNDYVEIVPVYEKN